MRVKRWLVGSQAREVRAEGCKVPPPRSIGRWSCDNLSKVEGSRIRRVPEERPNCR